MNTQMSNHTLESKEANRWKKMNISMTNYLQYISKKEYRYKLDLIDLLFISNFKGGNASIHEKAEELAVKLQPYEKILVSLESEFGGKALSDLTDTETDRLIGVLEKVCALSEQRETAIDGFKSSYLSTLFHCYFPELIPILDRRVLIGLEIVSQNDINGQGQIKNIETFYGQLVVKMKKGLIGKKIRDYDFEIFSRPFPTWVIKTKTL